MFVANNGNLVSRLTFFKMSNSLVCLIIALIQLLIFGPFKPK